MGRSKKGKTSLMFPTLISAMEQSDLLSSFYLRESHPFTAASCKVGTPRLAADFPY